MIKSVNETYVQPEEHMANSTKFAFKVMGSAIAVLISLVIAMVSYQIVKNDNGIREVAKGLKDLTVAITASNEQLKASAESALEVKKIVNDLQQEFNVRAPIIALVQENKIKIDEIQKDTKDRWTGTKQTEFANQLNQRLINIEKDAAAQAKASEIMINRITELEGLH